jgi:hypothetical protein
MDPKEKLKELEVKTVALCLAKLEEMNTRYEAGNFHGCPLTHLEESVKLAHRVRSLVV